ncbi:Fe-S protein assembly co-chaperone HscB [Usitatibacter palustris]|uniref:Co-chaperone protein HscB homolog n=1 Tax=Usitatibacter palustris TaxID=2732487 RepID=A0A6M4H5G4_9PROT|nr:Fe-S protein assembly co-chaperone HscB [Usitatibacter palustris]QJR14405.1 Co-chaperone protein HscB [Usitatibacter palustris]
MNETANHFELMGLPVAYAIDAARLEEGYRALQSRVHPDRYANASPAERRVAMQWATRANEAYSTLRDPLNRARYLLALRGFDTGEETNTAMPADFLMQQMQWREAASDARASRDGAALEALRKDLSGERSGLFRELEGALGAKLDGAAGCALVRKLRFLEKLDFEVDDALEQLHETAR